MEENRVKTERKSKVVPVTTHTLRTKWSSIYSANVVGFYGHSEKSAWRSFSNFYTHEPFSFELPEWCGRKELVAAGYSPKMQITFTEKGIMLCKAALMKDYESYERIAKSTAPAACKSLGRKVYPWDEELWNNHVCSIAKAVVAQKARNVPEVARALQKSGKQLIAEATARDKIWGIGINVTDDRLGCPNQWQGSNILGWALMEARKEINND